MCWLQACQHSLCGASHLFSTEHCESQVLHLPRGTGGEEASNRSSPGQDSVKWGLNCHTSELQNLNRNGMLRLHFRITFWLLVGVGLEGGQGESKEIGYRSSPAKGELWRRAVPWRGWRTRPHPAWRKFSADGIGLF